MGAVSSGPFRVSALARPVSASVTGGHGYTYLFAMLGQRALRFSQYVRVPSSSTLTGLGLLGFQGAVVSTGSATILVRLSATYVDNEDAIIGTQVSTALMTVLFQDGTHRVVATSPFDSATSSDAPDYGSAVIPITDGGPVTLYAYSTFGDTAGVRLVLDYTVLSSNGLALLFV